MVVGSTKLSNLLICLLGNLGLTLPRISVHEVGSSSSSSPDLRLPPQMSGPSGGLLHAPSLWVVDSSPNVCDALHYDHATTLLHNLPSSSWVLKSAQICCPKGPRPWGGLSDLGVSSTCSTCYFWSRSCIYTHNLLA